MAKLLGAIFPWFLGIATGIFVLVVAAWVIQLAFIALMMLLGASALLGAGNAVYNYTLALRNHIAFE